MNPDQMLKWALMSISEDGATHWIMAARGVGSSVYDAYPALGILDNMSKGLRVFDSQQEALEFAHSWTYEEHFPYYKPLLFNAVPVKPIYKTIFDGYELVGLTDEFSWDK